MIKILICEDSRVVAGLLEAIFDDEPGLAVVGTASDGKEAVRMVAELKPDIVTMDIRMPVMDGFEATRSIMSTNPLPIVVVSSSVDDEELRITFRAIEEGALAVIEKPAGFGSPRFDAIRRELVSTLRAMAEVKVVRRRPMRQSRPAVPSLEWASPDAARAGGTSYRLVAIGVSTGGPAALRAILSGLPEQFSLPVLIVQHIAPGFVGGLARWIQESTPLPVKLAAHGERLAGGAVYFAPDDRHLEVENGDGRLTARLVAAPPVDGFIPSVSALFRSVARCCPGAAIGCLLTGMGRDGADGLLEMRTAGCHTLVQDEASAVIYGMPGTALALNAVDRVLPIDQVAAYLSTLAGPAGKFA